MTLYHTTFQCSFVVCLFVVFLLFFFFFGGGETPLKSITTAQYQHTNKIPVDSFLYLFFLYETRYDLHNYFSYNFRPFFIDPFTLSKVFKRLLPTLQYTNILVKSIPREQPNQNKEMKIADFVQLSLYHWNIMYRGDKN